jgi:hypothetical protein
LAILICAASVLIAVWGAGQAISGDEWRYADALTSRGLSEALSNPVPGGGRYVIPIPLVVYDGLFRTFGIDSYAPYRVAELLALATIAVLLFVLVRRRAGALAGLAAAALVLTLGPAAGAIALSLRLPGMLALIAGLGALLALERPSGLGDVVACALLLVSVGSHPQSAPFVLAAAVLVLLRTGWERLRGAWVFLLPALVLLATLSAGAHPAGSSLGERLPHAPRFAFESLEGTISALTGLSNPFWTDARDPSTPLTAALAVGLIALVAWRLARTRPFPSFLAATTVCLIALLAAPVLAPSPQGVPNPNQARYLLPAAAVLVLVLAAALSPLPRGWPKAPLAWIATGALIFAISSNLLELHREQRQFVINSYHVRAELRALELARGRVPPGFKPESALPPEVHRGFPLSAASYYTVARRYGTPAFTAAELRRRGELVRGAFDAVLRASRSAARG